LNSELHQNLSDGAVASIHQQQGMADSHDIIQSYSLSKTFPLLILKTTFFQRSESARSENNPDEVFDKKSLKKILVT